MADVVLHSMVLLLLATRCAALTSTVSGRVSQRVITFFVGTNCGSLSLDFEVVFRGNVLGGLVLGE